MIKKLAVILVLCLTLSGCGYKDYYQAATEQNKVIYQMNLEQQKAEREAEREHQERMMVLMQSSMTAAAKTEDKTDDVLVPLLIMSMEDKRVMAEALTSKNRVPMQLNKIEAPESFGDAVRKSTGAILGIGGIVLGITNSNNMKSIAVEGMKNAGVHNSIDGDSNTITSDSYKAGGDSSTLDMSTTSTEMLMPEE